MPYPYQASDVGDRPGREPLSPDEKQARAEEWNANHRAMLLAAWEQEMAELDGRLMSDARFWEELASGQVSETARKRVDTLIDERRVKRQARPS